MTHTEKTVLRYLARGWNYKTIANQMGVPLSTIHTHTSNIRKKTNIKSTLDKQECIDYLYGRGKLIMAGTAKIPYTKSTPTQAQLRVMLLYAQDRTIAQIANDLSIGQQTVANALSQGCIKAGVHRKALRYYLESIGALTPVDPMDDPMF